MSDDYLWNRSGEPDPEVARLEKLMSPLAHDAPLDELRMRRSRRPLWFVVGLAVAVAAAVTLYVVLPRDPVSRGCSGDSGFAFTSEGGRASCGGSQVATGVLPVGGELDTGAHEAKLTIADIGTARLGANTRVRLERTDKARHQLMLERGHLHAKVVAPPRLFTVTTKHTDVVDLGCEYTIDVDDTGAGSIRVLTGIVELATKSGAIVVAPEGTSTALLAGQRPGLPVGHAANSRVRDAVRAYDRGDAGAVDALLLAAEERDAITLIALVAVDAPHRPAVLARLYELSPPPDAEITPDTAREDPEKLLTWSQDIIAVYRGVYAHPR